MTSEVVLSETGAYSEITKQIRVSVLPAPLVNESDPKDNVFAFSYTITIENLGSESVQLLERHWIIKSGQIQIAEVVGPGVVGVQPVIEIGQQFEYTSGAVIHDPFGSMQGSYTFKNEEGKYFEVIIPRFDLFYPMVVH